MDEPHLIAIAGPPASGKSTLARQIAVALHWPLICKDTIKEALYEALGTDDRAWSQRLGAAAIHVLFALAEEILRTGASVIVESTFKHERTPCELAALVEATGARLTVVYCHAAPEVLAQRFNRRARSDRHPGHRDPDTVTSEDVAASWLWRPDYPGVTIEVDTTDLGAVCLPSILDAIGLCRSDDSKGPPSGGAEGQVR
ncbi:MAG: ATP-binding protein [Anaerolineae bacterium]|nr:ATP-binding protein [Anaerolineae bacterium]